MIKIQKLSKFYGKRQVLNDIDLSFEKGKVYGIVGDNGSGKTTLFRCIAGLEKYNGKITSDLKVLKNHIGLLLTEPYFFDKITAREYLQLMCNARNVQLEYLDTQNIFDLPLKQYASTYSTGMKKKLALTAILLQKNECFILDEPFNGVDIQSNMIISELIKKLKAADKTIVISSHIFSTLAETCDEIHVLKNGQFVRKVLKEEFSSLEAEMKNFTIGNRIDQLNIY
ncbi:ATP-binding cassette domain-containing protein [Aureibaculum sp. A20]|uniref:ATP-binding cassette domain-containing protein n=1 Tax=Aureibaculum flavum TaxID=2795986 RepID=A0ABS0WW63_9FLAO|nr:ATP-binding cassette domain-containing protein [Aureibaculum flavum]MBJ2176234.1 ATP-binding cassette domain-containing protein [Aureibaculum flavum]